MKVSVGEWREEFKYWLDAQTARSVLGYAKPFVAPDPHAGNCSEPTYTVTSIYFDSSRLDFYFHSMDGLRFRKKLRVRSYLGQGLPPCLFLEIKHKRGRKVLKERAPVPTTLNAQVLTTDGLEELGLRVSLEPQARRAAERFVWFKDKLGLSSVVAVAYERCAYVDLCDQTIRLTMDYDVRCLLHPGHEVLFGGHGFHPCTDGHVILELKFGGRMPHWMLSLVRNYGLTPTAISKYCMSVGRCMVRPNFGDLGPANRGV